MKKLTFDDIFLGVEGDDGQVAGEPGKAGWNIFLDSDSNFSLFHLYMRCVHENGSMSPTPKFKGFGR